MKIAANDRMHLDSKKRHSLVALLLLQVMRIVMCKG